MRISRSSKKARLRGLPCRSAGDARSTASIARAAFPAGAVSRMVVGEGVAALVIGLALVVLRPVRLFGGRIDDLGHALSGQAAPHRADRSARYGANRVFRLTTA